MPELLSPTETKTAKKSKKPPTPPPTENPELISQPLSNTLTKPKRWNDSIELEYDPTTDQFLDTKTKHPVWPLLDADASEEFFGSDLIESLKFDSDNSEWITKFGGADRLKLEEILFSDA